MIDPTREEWLAARERVRSGCLNRSGAHALAAAALGPCPPEPAPPSWYCGSLAVTRDGGVWVGFAGRHEMVTPDEADRMAAALIDHARYARKQEADDSWRSDEEAAALMAAIKEPATPEPICGRLLVGRGTDTWDPVCQRPKGHPAFCQSSPDGLDE